MLVILRFLRTRKYVVVVVVLVVFLEKTASLKSNTLAKEDTNENDKDIMYSTFDHRGELNVNANTEDFITEIEQWKFEK